VDYNKQQLDGYTKDVMDLGYVAAKFESFGWHAQSIDGHDVSAIYNAIENAKAHRNVPSVIVLNTCKGKGCTYAEGLEFSHHMTFTKQQSAEAIESAAKALAVCEGEV
jgi:transketolase